MNSKNYTMDFTIPQGPTGPTGPANGLNSYGARYNNNSTYFTLGIDSEVQVSLPNFTTTNDMNYTPANSITIGTDGTYEITYSINTIGSIKTSFTTVVRVNGKAISSTKNTKQIDTIIYTNFYGNTIYTLQKGDIVDLAISSTNNVTVNLNNNASLVLKKVD